MTTATKKLELELDETDYDDIQKAIARRQAWRCMPDPEEGEEPAGNTVGNVLAEICRGWLERVDNEPGGEITEGEEWKS